MLDALAVNQSPQPYPLLGAIPLTNSLRLFPGAGETDTTVLTYLFMNPFAGFDAQQQSAAAYINANLAGVDDHTVGVAGSIPARAQQAQLVTSRLPVLELVTILAIALLVGLNYRAPIPPVIALTASAVAFLVTLRLAGLVEELLGLAIPAELEPLLVALLLGIVTDYTIFYLSAFRNELHLGAAPRLATARAISSFTPIVVAAGITVAAGTAALLAAKSAFFQAVGPAMALCIVVGLVVSITLIPALMAIVGRWIFWPATGAVEHGESAPLPTFGTSASSHPSQTRFIEWLIVPKHAAYVLLACVCGLLVASLPLRHVQLGIGFTQSLPSSNPVKVAATAAAAGFAPGITSPTTILIERAGVTRQREELNRLQRLVAEQQGVAGVLGPADNLTPVEAGVFLATSTDAARILVIFDHDPLEATAIDDLAELTRQLPDLIKASGLSGVFVSIAGDTALAEGLVQSTGDDLIRIAVAALVINLILLTIFLRALVAPLYLLASSVLALTAAMGLTTFVFQDLLGNEGLTFYVPFAAAVLLIALGSDYNIFGVGHVWDLARDVPLRSAIVRAIPESTRAITAAGATLAVSFALLAVIPLRPFRELGFAMAVGIALDVGVIRTLVTPCTLALVGPVSGWPGRRLAGPRHEAPPARPEEEPAPSTAAQPDATGG